MTAKCLLKHRIVPFEHFRLLATIIASAVGIITPSMAAEEGATSAWIHPDAKGKLVYKATSTGDRIMDFSYAGYRGGGVALPTVAIKVTVKPTGGEDDTAAIQTAIDQVAAMPPQDGFRGAVLLAPGVYRCAGTITISASGIVLRGSGSAPGPMQSTLLLTGKPHLALAVRAPGGRGGRAASEEDGPTKSADEIKPASVRTTIADAYVPSGAMSFAVLDAKDFVPRRTDRSKSAIAVPWARGTVGRWGGA